MVLHPLSASFWHFEIQPQNKLFFNIFTYYSSCKITILALFKILSFFECYRCFFLVFYFKPFFFFLHKTTLMGFYMYTLFMYLALWSSVPKYSIFHHTALVQPLQIDHFLSLQNLVISGILGILSRSLCINFLIRS